VTYWLLGLVLALGISTAAFFAARTGNYVRHLPGIRSNADADRERCLDGHAPLALQAG